MKPDSFHKIDTALQFDDEEDFIRVGLIALATDLTSEHDFACMCRHPRLRLHVTRTDYSNPVTPENLYAMEAGLERSTALLAPETPFKAIYYSCTAGAAMLGNSLIEKKIHSVKPQVTVVTPLNAALQALHASGSTKLSILTPYTADVARLISDYFSNHGQDITRVSFMGLDNDQMMARLSFETIVAAAVAATSKDADALFISCTALRSAQVAQRIEQIIDRPVITSNQAAAWMVMRTVDLDPPSPRYGRLMSLPRREPR